MEFRPTRDILPGPGIGRSAWALALAAVIFCGPPAYATNGYFPNGYDAESKGMAGAGVTLAEGPVATAENPALGVKMGNRGGGCLSLLGVYRDVTNSGNAGPAAAPLVPGTTRSDRDHYGLPCAGYNFAIDDKTALGALIYVAGGLNSHYGTNVFAHFGPVAATPLGVDFAQVFISANLARQLADGVTIGIAPVFAGQRFAAYGLQPFEAFSTKPRFVTNNGYDYSFGGGVKIGGLWDPADWLTLGVSYQSRMWMQKLSKYQGLFANAGEFDIPAAVTSGITVRPSAKLDLTFEDEVIFFSGVSSLSNTGAINPFLPTSPANWRLGATDGAGLGWRDVNVFRLAAQWRASDPLTLRTGFSHATNFIRNDQMLFNIVSPATVTDHASMGFSYAFTPVWTGTFGYTHAFSNSFSGPLVGDPGQTIHFRLEEDELVFGASYRW